MGPIWVLSAPVGPHVDPMNLVIRGYTHLRDIYHDSRVIYRTPWRVVFSVKSSNKSRHEGNFTVFAGLDSAEKELSLYFHSINLAGTLVYNHLLILRNDWRTVCITNHSTNQVFYMRKHTGHYEITMDAQHNVPIAINNTAS